MISIEAIEKVLKSAGVSLTRESIGDEVFDRVIRFETGGNQCSIEWWANLGYLTIGRRFSSYVSFDDMEVDDTYPSFRKGIKFLENGHVVCRLAVELLPWQLEVCDG